MKKNILSLLFIPLLAATYAQADIYEDAGDLFPPSQDGSADDFIEDLIQQGFASGKPLTLSINGKKVAELGKGSNISWDLEKATTIVVPADTQIQLTKPGPVIEILEEGTYENVKFSSLKYISARYLGSENFVLDYQASPNNTNGSKPSCLNAFLNLEGINKPIKINEKEICVGDKVTLLSSKKLASLGIGDSFQLNYVTPEGVELTSNTVRVLNDEKMVLAYSYYRFSSAYKSTIASDGMKLTFDNSPTSEVNANYDSRYDKSNIVNILLNITPDDFK